MKLTTSISTLRKVAPPVVILLAASLAGLAQGASTSRPEPTSEQRTACRSDFQRLCPGTRPGGGRVRACFEANLADLSPLCREAFEAQQRSENGS